MDIISAISEQTVSVALSLVVVWFYNKLVTDFLLERKEMVEALRAERKEWLDTSDRYIHQLFEVIRTSTEAAVTQGREMHALRSKLTEFMLRLEKAEYDKPQP